MPFSQNPKECGWFYHAPAKKNVGAPKVEYPAPSNIPGLGFDDPADVQKQEIKEMMFKDTDTNYIKLAKMGGRKDLLSFKTENERQKSAGPIGYPRNDWFYLEDNKLEDDSNRKTEEKQPWQFLLPDYMVHKSYQPSFEDPNNRPTRSAAPYYTEANSEIDNGRLATDKTVKIPELRKPGFGVRLEKPALSHQKLPPREKMSKPQDAEISQGDKQKNNQVIMPSEKDEPTNMMKLLSGEYEREWYSKLSELQDQKTANKAKTVNNNQSKNMFPEKNSSAHHRRGKTDLHSNYAHKLKTDQEEKEPFVLNRFKNIPPKVDSYQRTEVMAAVK
ncbi:hypothetical protein Btru_030862 [Bulinus truncatus]|nr:hypothetical protein Btru_030862 [Bulinus truncatus]